MVANMQIHECAELRIALLICSPWLQKCKTKSLRDVNSFPTIGPKKQEVGGSAGGQANYCKSIGVILLQPPFIWGLRHECSQSFIMVIIK